ncbi:MFS transporter [Paeniglutamicibacter sp. ABSL32-1]|uniref:MFS transporter n=1 Tax=Paeniglutamicibacter quisquiliarum TaxID=2849498 RepID=UPI001C2D365B|nr:MFS transporter [Paeniglutamicibacter quisquiliarum]MBV1777882.1 MFS transporter [Paeniglutamicibacter quisquiliarum]
MSTTSYTSGGNLTQADAGNPRVGLWRGRIPIIVGLLLLGIGLRYAVTGLSPLLTTVTGELGIGTAGATFIGMLPTLSFGIGGFLAPVIVRRIGLEATALVAVILAAAGTLVRPFSDSPAMFMALTFVALLGMGFGNVAGAPLVKKHFPDRQASMVTVFALLMQAGATLPAMTALPLANAGGWQLSLASWGVLSLVAVLPWTLVLLKERRSGAPAAQAATAGAAAGSNLSLGRLVASPVAVGTALFYAMASLNIYAMLAWLPTIMQQGFGLDKGAAATAFSIYTFMTLPMAVITPLIANKMRNPAILAVVLAAAGPLGYLLMVLGIGPLWLAALVAGLAGGAFPLAIAMFNLRSRTTAGSAAMAGFAMGVGYLFGTLGPLLGGWLFSTTGGWTVPLWVYVATFIPMALGGMMMARTGRYVEDTAGTAAKA